MAECGLIGELDSEISAQARRFRRSVTGVAPSGFRVFVNVSSSNEPLAQTIERQRDTARAEPLNVNPKPRGSWTDPEAGEFVEEVRRDLIRRFGREAPYARGFIIRSTVDLDRQKIARDTLSSSLISLDPRRSKGFRGAVGFMNYGEGWQNRLAKARFWKPDPRAQFGIVLDSAQTFGLVDGKKVPIPQADKDWALRSAKPLADGALVWLGRRDDGTLQLLRQQGLQGALVSIDVRTGAVIAMAGGLEVEDSGFNRATQALRQPGSAFKPIIYAAALEQGLTPDTKISDQKIRGGGWSPENADRRFYGAMTLSQGLVMSRNTVTVRIARRVGMRRVADYARRFGVYDDLPNDLTMALGAGETTVLKLTAGFAVFPNGGRYLPPVFYDRLQDPRGRTVWRSDRRSCPACDVAYDATRAPPAIEPWLFGLPHNLLRTREAPEKMKTRYTAQERNKEDSTGSIQDPSQAHIDPNHTFNTCFK